ncbi:MAG TPA: hypothetical protein VK559_08455 [Ferruginibacter sp.]|nr:hypothetical protein [Ferruginibacter sp.]
MIKNIFAVFLLSSMLFACHSKKGNPTTALDTGRLFIRTTLDGNFNDAEDLLYKDTMNVEIFESYKAFFSRLPDDTKDNYKQSDYTINKYTDLNDSTAVIDYSNSYMNKPMQIKVLKINGQWKIDFKYTTSADSTN